MKDGNSAGIFLEQALKNMSIPEPTPARKREPLAICRMSPIIPQESWPGLLSRSPHIHNHCTCIIASPQRAKSHLRPTSVFSLSGPLRRLDCGMMSPLPGLALPPLTLLSSPQCQLKGDKFEDLVDNVPQDRRHPGRRCGGAASSGARGTG